MSTTWPGPPLKHHYSLLRVSTSCVLISSVSDLRINVLTTEILSELYDVYSIQCTNTIPPIQDSALTLPFGRLDEYVSGTVVMEKERFDLSGT